MEDYTVNGRKAYRIHAKVIRRTAKAALMDCEGQEEWFPLSYIKILPDNTAMVQDWLYKEKFGDEVVEYNDKPIQKAKEVKPVDTTTNRKEEIFYDGDRIDDSTGDFPEEAPF